MADSATPSDPVRRHSDGRAAQVYDFARSELFDRTFAEGMALVEETAAYLDGEGRRESKRLGRNTALAYAGESMRLTTRLMQIASWLLVQRAVREGDMAPADACDEKYRVGGQAVCQGGSEAGGDLPEPLLDLMERSERLYERVLYLDRKMYREAADAAPPNPVLNQVERLRAAFGG
jgi:regulator of CtrA degradation